MEAIRTCVHCQKQAFSIDDLEEFSRAKGAKYGRENICKKCKVVAKSARPALVYTVEQQERIRLLKRDSHLKRMYKFSNDEYDSLLESQGGVCGICKVPPVSSKNAFREYLVVDHDHITGDVRGLLCMSCNTALGSFNDDINTLNTAIQYLRDA